MRLIGMLAVVTGTLVLAGCSDGGGTPPPENTAPVANFAVPPCTIDVACNFASTSTDDVGVTSWSWDFNGDGTRDASTESAPYTYKAAGNFNVSLTVLDAQGLDHTKTTTITIAEPPPPVNVPPTAAFTFTCDVFGACAFNASTSTDAAPGTIATYAWTFGDGAIADVVSPSHSYIVTVPTDFTVTLTVTDNEGAIDVETQTVTLSPAPNTPPTAGFIHTCRDAVCTFTSTSTDVAPGTIATYAWTFGDGGTAAVRNPLHSYAITAPADFTVTLTVTDNDGASDVETQTLTASPPPPVAESCTTSISGTRVECAFNITARSTVKLKLLAISCDLAGQKVTAPPPIGDQVFSAVCRRTVGEELGIFGGPLDEAIVYEAGSQLRIRFDQGTVFDGSDPVLGPAAAHFEGTFPNWTIHFEDGQNPGREGEPDFADVVLGVRAIAVP